MILLAVVPLAVPRDAPGWQPPRGMI